MSSACRAHSRSANNVLDHAFLIMLCAVFALICSTPYCFMSFAKLDNAVAYDSLIRDSSPLKIRHEVEENTPVYIKARGCLVHAKDKTWILQSFDECKKFVRFPDTLETLAASTSFLMFFEFGIVIILGILFTSFCWKKTDMWKFFYKTGVPVSVAFLCTSLLLLYSAIANLEHVELNTTFFGFCVLESILLVYSFLLPLPLKRHKKSQEHKVAEKKS